MDPVDAATTHCRVVDNASAARGTTDASANAASHQFRVVDHAKMRRRTRHGPSDASSLSLRHPPGPPRDDGPKTAPTPPTLRASL